MTEFKVIKTMSIGVAVAADDEKVLTLSFELDDGELYIFPYYNADDVNEMVLNMKKARDMVWPEGDANESV